SRASIRRNPARRRATIAWKSCSSRRARARAERRRTTLSLTRVCRLAGFVCAVSAVANVVARAGLAEVAEGNALVPAATHVRRARGHEPCKRALGTRFTGTRQ